MRFHVQDGIVTNTFVHVGISTVTKNNNYLKVFKRVSIIIIIIIIMKDLYSGYTAALCALHNIHTIVKIKN